MKTEIGQRWIRPGIVVEISDTNDDNVFNLISANVVQTLDAAAWPIGKACRFDRYKFEPFVGIPDSLVFEYLAGQDRPECN